MIATKLITCAALAMGCASAALAMPVNRPASTQAAASDSPFVHATMHVHRRHHLVPTLPRRDDFPPDPQPGPAGAGGFVVNRYGYGNYVGGPNGFAGYPAGSGEAFIYRQQQNWKCEYAPESC